MTADQFAEIYEHYFHPMYLYAMKLCRDHQLAQDVTAEVFARLLEQLQIGAGPQTNLRAYLYTSIYHRVIDVYRKDRRLRDLDELDGLPIEEMLDEDIERALQAGWLARHARRLLAPHQLRVLQLRFVEGLNLAETAEVLGRNVPYVKTRQHEALTRLRNAAAQALPS